MLKHKIDTVSTNPMESKWSESNAFVYCSAHVVNFEGTQILTENMIN